MHRTKVGVKGAYNFVVARKVVGAVAIFYMDLIVHNKADEGK